MAHDIRSLPQPIERLPVELLRAVLSAVPDIRSLHSAVLSCPLLYRAFIDAEESIANQVLINQIDESVLPEAIAASRSSWPPLCDHAPLIRETVHPFINEYLHQRPELPKSWSPHEAYHLAKTHALVDYFTRSFVTSALSSPPLSPTEGPATRREICRIQRALYRFQIYCNCFPAIDYWDADDTTLAILRATKELFFENFAPWENEQLGCVHDFLTRAISPAFDDVACHDIAWGYAHVVYGGGVNLPGVGYLLSLGLDKLHQIARAETYEERYRLIGATHAAPSTECLLYDALVATRGGSWSMRTPEPGEAPKAQLPSVSEVDSGPEDVWLWSHQQDSNCGLVYRRETDSLRRWGYVLWNRARLDAVGILNKPWERPGLEEALRGQDDPLREQTYVEKSWAERERLFEAGGSGWWDFGDESQVQWLGDKAKKPSYNPNSCSC